MAALGRNPCLKPSTPRQRLHRLLPFRLHRKKGEQSARACWVSELDRVDVETFYNATLRANIRRRPGGVPLGGSDPLNRPTHAMDARAMLNLIRLVELLPAQGQKVTGF